MLPYRHNTLTRIALIAFFVLVVIYAYFEAQNILFGPKIVLDANQIRTVAEQNIIISGTALNIASIRMNGRSIEVTEGGNFEESLLLSEGLNTIHLTAEDKFGRTTKKELEVVYMPQNSGVGTTTSPYDQPS